MLTAKVALYARCCAAGMATMLVAAGGISTSPTPRVTICDIIATRQPSNSASGLEVERSSVGTWAGPCSIMSHMTRFTSCTRRVSAAGMCTRCKLRSGSVRSNRYSAHAVSVRSGGSGIAATSNCVGDAVERARTPGCGVARDALLAELTAEAGSLPVPSRPSSMRQAIRSSAWVWVRDTKAKLVESSRSSSRCRAAWRRVGAGELSASSRPVTSRGSRSTSLSRVAGGRWVTKDASSCRARCCRWVRHSGSVKPE
ncbi:hypothetical protein V8C86DRAFT_2617250 [Haematococcus lacustris]